MMYKTVWKHFWKGPISYGNQSIDLQSKTGDWFLYAVGFY